jgi:hypothetical protein
VCKEIVAVEKKISLRQLQRMSGPEIVEILLDSPVVVTLNDADCFEIRLVDSEDGD